MPAGDFNLDDYEEISPVFTATSSWLVDAWEKLDKPTTPLSDQGEKLMAVIIAAWEELSPKEAKKWYEDRKEYQVNELSTKEQVHHHTGRSLASYPFPIFQIMKTMFPEFDATKRENCIKMVKRFPIFRMANKV